MYCWRIRFRIFDVAEKSNVCCYVQLFITFDSYINVCMRALQKILLHYGLVCVYAWKPLGMSGWGKKVAAEHKIPTEKSPAIAIILPTKNHRNEQAWARKRERDRIKPKYVFWILWKFGTSGILIYRFYKCMYGCAHANIQTVNIQFCGLCIIFLVMFHIFLLRSFNGDSNGENFGGWECRWKSTEKFPLIILFTCSFFSLSRPFFR